MELKKHIKAVKEAINTAYFGIQDALIQRDEKTAELKAKGWNEKESAFRQEYEAIVEQYNNTIAETVTKCKDVVQKEKTSYMDEVTAYYRADGSRIDLNFMNLVKAEIPLSVGEITAEVINNADNPTMLRVIHKYILDRNAHLSKDQQIALDLEYTKALYRSDKQGKNEEKIFDDFVHLAAMGLNHPDKSFTMYQAKLDEYAEDAELKLLKGKLIIDEAAQREIDEIERKQIERNNEKNKGRTWGGSELPPVKITKVL